MNSPGGELILKTFMYAVEDIMLYLNRIITGCTRMAQIGTGEKVNECI